MACATSSLDTAEELAKILAETGGDAAQGLGPVRAPGAAEGRRAATTCPASSAPRRPRPRRCCARHGRMRRGSACTSMSARSAWTRWPGARAMALAGEVIRAAGVPIEVVDVGGGFPVAYPDVDAAPARRLLRRDRGGLRGAGPAGRGALGRAGPRAGGRRRQRGGAGAAAPRGGAVRERRRLWRAVGCRRAGLPLPLPADPAGR